MVRLGEIKPEQADDRADQPLDLPIDEAEHDLERQRGQDRQVGVLGLPAQAHAQRSDAFQARIAASENHTVKLPRRRKLSSYSRQFTTLRFCSGIWWRRSWFSLKGKASIPVRKGLPRSGSGRHRPDPCNKVPGCGDVSRCSHHPRFQRLPLRPSLSSKPSRTREQG